MWKILCIPTGAFVIFCCDKHITISLDMFNMIDFILDNVFRYTIRTICARHLAETFGNLAHASAVERMFLVLGPGYQNWLFKVKKDQKWPLCGGSPLAGNSAHEERGSQSVCCQHSAKSGLRGHRWSKNNIWSPFLEASLSNPYNTVQYGLYCKDHGHGYWRNEGAT